MDKFDDALLRSTLMSERIRQRTDVELRALINAFGNDLDFLPLEELMISQDAWNHVRDSGLEPKTVFAHPEILKEYPRLSEYYRGIALLPRKRVADIAVAVVSWETKGRKARVTEDQSKRVARLYNAVISSIIEGATNWTLENGYRNIIANMGIGLDGTFRNIIGQDAENLIRTRISNWLEKHGLIRKVNDDKTDFKLVKGYSMRYGSEPDILFLYDQNGVEQIVATIEIKGGKDPAGALERLGAMRKSFEATPPGCVNILIAGVVTSEMSTRLDQMGVNKVYLLDKLAHDGEDWLAFINEIFHYIIRITDTVLN